MPSLSCAARPTDRQSMPSPKSQALRRLAVQLVLLFWPEEEEAARGSVLQAIDLCAGVDVQQNLHRPAEKGSKQRVARIPKHQKQVQANQLSMNPRSLRAIVLL